MPTTRLSHSIPFWVLVGGSVVSIAGGAYVLVTKLDLIATSITDGTATGVEVYAGQIWAVLGAILVGAGLVGLALALTLGALRSFASPAVDVVEIVDAPAWEEDVVAAPAAAEPAAVVDAEPALVADEPAPVALTDADVETSTTGEPHTR